MENQILAVLRNIEQEYEVRIIYACESGSRAWGFASTDSDFDVRFIYAHELPWYLNIMENRDIIELPENNNIDVNGWDIKKALNLLHNSNPPLLEWLNSPIVYYENSKYLPELKKLATQYYSEKACLHHYLHMAEGNYREYLHNEIVWQKKYFYVLRPLLACRWIENGKGIIPVRFQELLTLLEKESQVRKEIDLLVEKKIAGNELDKGLKIQVLNDYIENEMERIKKAIPNISKKPDSAPLNNYFSWVISNIFN
jgi:uncharacterized protein